MAFSFDATTNKISMPPGDTGDIYFEITYDTQGKDAAVVFAVVNRRTGEDIFKKHAKVTGGKAHIRLCNHDTRDIDAGTYAWQVRIVTSPAEDEEGNVIADECSDDVISVFSGGSLPVFVLEKKGARV